MDTPITSNSTQMSQSRNRSFSKLPNNVLESLVKTLNVFTFSVFAFSFDDNLRPRGNLTVTVLNLRSAPPLLRSTIVACLLLIILFGCAPADSMGADPGPSSNPTTVSAGPTAKPTASSDALDSYLKVVGATAAQLSQYKGVIESETKAVELAAKQGHNWMPQTEGGYFGKRGIDLVTAPSTLIVFVSLIVLVYYRKEVTALLRSSQSFRVGPVEIVRAAIQEIKSEFVEGPLLRFQVSDSSLSLEDFLDYPTRMEGQRVRNLFFELKANDVAYRRLVVLETRLALLEDRLRASPYFDSDGPPANFLEQKNKLFSLFLSVGNVYGFARKEDETVEVDSAEYYLAKAISLQPLDRKNLAGTIGYAHFCIAAVKGANALMRHSECRTEGVGDMHAAIEQVLLAERAGFKPSYQYHLKALLYSNTDRVKPALAAWKRAAELSFPPSWKMHFNCACLLALTKEYAEALNELERAVAAYHGHHNTLDPKLSDLARSSDEGAELEPFHVRNNRQWEDANRATSADGRTFAQILKSAEGD